MRVQAAAIAKLVNAIEQVLAAAAIAARANALEHVQAATIDVCVQTFAISAYPLPVKPLIHIYVLNS